MRLFGRARSHPEAAATVSSWGEEPIGAAQVDTILGRQGALLAGFTSPNPAGWGLAGSVETTDQTIWASPQAFTGGAGRTALSVFAVGADKPTVYPQDAHTAQIVLPGIGGI